MKRSLFLVLVLALLLVLFCSGTAMADYSGSCGENVTFSFQPGTGVLTISGTGDMKAYVIPSDLPWYSYRENITSIVIDSGVTKLGYGAFDGCSSVTSVSIPSSVTSISDVVFANCRSLISVDIPDGVTEIGRYLFYQCYSLTEVTIPDGVTRIGTCAFNYCTSLTDVTIPDGVTYIGYDAFRACTALSSITLPNSVSSIKDNAFYACSSLSYVTINNPDAAIGTDAFGRCASDLLLRGWTPSTAKTYADEAGISFESLGTRLGPCGDSASFELDHITGTLTIRGTGDMYDYYSLRDIPWYDCRPMIETVVIENGITGIGYNAFLDCMDLTGVTIPNSVTAVGSMAFRGCFSLTELVLPGSVAAVGDYAFRDCGSLASVTVGNPNAALGDDLFRGCPSGVILRGWPGSTAEAYAQAASGVSFEPLAAASGRCGEHVTWSLDPVTGVLTLSGTGATWDYNKTPSPFAGNSSIRSVEIENGVTGLGIYLFSNCGSLTHVSIPNSVSFIEGSAFYYCTALTNVAIPTGVTDLRSLCFSNCSSLIDVTILNPTCVIGNGSPNVFYNCSANLVIHGWAGSTAEAYAQAADISFLPLDPSAFVLPAGLTAIQADAFRNIAAESVRIPAGVTSISGDPFAGSGVKYIYGTPGSRAESFARDYGYVFVPYTG